VKSLKYKVLDVIQKACKLMMKYFGNLVIQIQV
jgi:hypothetical protein